MKHPKWLVRVVADDRGRYTVPKVEVEGAAFANMLGDALEKLADLASYDDNLTEAWFNYVNARRAVVKAEWDLVGDEAREGLIEAMDDAKAAVMAELSPTVRLDMAEALLLADGLFEAAGRIGTVAP